MKRLLFRSPLVFALLGLAGASAQDNAAPKDGALGTYINKDPNDTHGQLQQLELNVNKLQVDTTVELFLLQYGSEIHLNRTYCPATTADHEMIPCYVFTPANLAKGERRPGLVMVHGALHESLDWRFFHLISEAVAHGYVIIFPEYRGSIGYGETINVNSYGHTDVADAAAAADYFAKQDFVDGSRLGILGHSRGGLVTVLALEREPKRFQAAVEISGLLDFMAYMAYKPDERRADTRGRVAASCSVQDLLPTWKFHRSTSWRRSKPRCWPWGRRGTRSCRSASKAPCVLIELLKAHDKVFDGHVYDNAPGGHDFLQGDSDDQRDCFKRSFDWLGKYLKLSASSGGPLGHAECANPLATILPHRHNRTVMNPSRARWALACGLFAWVAAFSVAQGEPPDRRSESGLALFETPDAWRPYVSGPVTAFARSADDVLFVGSNRLTAFDGYSWSDIAVPGASSFRALVASRDGLKIWIGAANGVVGDVERNDRGEWSFHSLDAALALAGALNPGEKQHVAFGDIRHIHLDGDRVLFVARESILRWNPPTAAAAGHFEVWNLPSNVRLYPFSDRGRLLIYQMGVGLLRMEENGPKLWLEEKSLPSRPPMVAYLSVPDGGEYAVFNDEVFRHVGESWIRLDEASHILHDKRAQRAVEMPDGRMAIGTAYGGCILLRSDGTVLRVLDGQSGLPDVNVVRLWADPEDQLWIGLWTGFVRLSGLGLASLYDQRLGFVAFVPHKVLRVGGELTVISSQGVYTLAPSPRSFETSSFTRQEEYFRQLWDGVDLDGHLWLGASDGLWKVSDGKVVREPAVSSGIFFLSTLRALPHGLLFFDDVACKAWLSDRQGWHVTDLHQRLESAPAATMEDSDGRLWVATQGGQVQCFEWDPANQQLRSIAHNSHGHGNPFPGVRPIRVDLPARSNLCSHRVRDPGPRSGPRSLRSGQPI